MSGNLLVSVLLPVYNGEMYLGEAIESILGQSWRDFELILINDGSTDGSQAILKQYERKDSRITVYEQGNLGLIATLNRGLELARGEYIARMDADDISLPRRLELQVETLQSDPKLVLAGSAYYVIDEAGNILRIDRQPVEDTEIRWKMLFKNAFAHSSVMLRAKSFGREKVKYDQRAFQGEDYDLWSRLLQTGKVCNIQQPLIKRRIHPQQMSTIASGLVTRMETCISRANLNRLGIDVSDEELRSLREWFDRFPKRLRGDDPETCWRMVEILNAFGRQPEIDRKFYHRIRARWLLRFLAVPGYAKGHFRKRDLLKQIQLRDILAIPALAMKKAGR